MSEQRLKPGRFYMHTSAMDVALYVISTGAEGEVYGTWYNLGYVGSPFPLGKDTVLQVMTEQWIDVTDKINVKRIKPGVPK
jgi:hypothetical protein